MNTARLIAIAVLAGGTVMAGGSASAQPRLEREVSFKAQLPVTEPAQIGEWLQRLTGRFKYDGMVQMSTACAEPPSAEGGPPPPPSDMCQSMSGKSDCIKVGEGSGVQCILNVTWQDIFAVDFQNGTVREVLVSYLDPAMELYGLDPGSSHMARQIVNNKGIAEAGPGAIKGNTGTFASPCANTEELGCGRIVRIEARPDANVLWAWFSTKSPNNPETTYAVITLRRVTTDEVSAPTLKPVSQRHK